MYVMGDNGVFKRASEARLKTDIAKYQEMLETSKGPIIIDGLGTFNPDDYFQYIQDQGIIEDKETDVIDNGDGTYDVTTKPGYIFLVELLPTKENPVDAKIEYLGQAGKVAPIIKKIETSATSTSITAKAIVVRLGSGTVTYYYKLASASDNEYQEITNVNEETGATQNTGITAGEKYIIKVVAKNEVGEAVKTAEIIATRIFVESISLNKTEEKVSEGKTTTLIATVKPDNATNKTVRWESSDTTIATVSDTGVVTGKKVGNVTITAKATDGSNVTASCIVTVKLPTVADIVDQVQEENKVAEDENGNPITVPGGFKVVPDTEDNDVDYTYSGDKKPCVQDGIVIEDEEGNQFVWIPVGDIKNKDGTTTTITLGRYKFNATDGTPNLKQNADNYAETVTIENYFQELVTGSGNLASRNLGGFVTKTKMAGGYYFARFESSRGTDGKIKSKANQSVSTDAGQNTAAQWCRAMYSGNDYVVSDLINSYSWDTAIVFIQEYSGNSNYANQTRKSTSLLKTGKAGDKICNIHDMASNYYEWTTEHYAGTGIADCVNRGGYASHSNAVSSQRDSSIQSPSGNAVTSRVLLWIK